MPKSSKYSPNAAAPNSFPSQKSFQHSPNDDRYVGMVWAVVNNYGTFGYTVYYSYCNCFFISIRSDMQRWHHNQPLVLRRFQQPVRSNNSNLLTWRYFPQCDMISKTITVPKPSLWQYLKIDTYMKLLAIHIILSIIANCFTDTNDVGYARSEHDTTCSCCVWWRIWWWVTFVNSISWIIDKAQPFLQ